MNIFKQKPIWYIASIGISLICLYILYRLIIPNLDDLSIIKENFSIGPILLTIPVYYLGLYSASIVWGKMMNDLTDPLPEPQHQNIYIITHAARRIPGFVWHVLGRITWYEQMGIRKSITAFANGLETVLIIVSGLVMVAIFFPFLSQKSGVEFWQIILGIGIGSIFFHPKFIQKILQKLGQGYSHQEITYKMILKWFLYYLIIWLTGGTVLFLIVSSMLQVTFSLWPVCIVIWCIAGVAGMLLIFLPSGFGLNEATISLLLAMYISSSLAVAAAIIIRILLTIFDFVIATILISIRNRRSPPAQSKPKSIGN